MLVTVGHLTDWHHRIAVEGSLAPTDERPRVVRVDQGLVGTELEGVRRSWDNRDCALYALGIGAGQMNPYDDLQFTTDGTDGKPQQVYPTFGVLAGTEAGVGRLLEHLGDAVDFTRMLHGEQQFVQYVPLPVQASVITTPRISAVWDKGSATVIETVAHTVDENDGTVYCRATQSMFFRNIGGWGGERGPSAAKVVLEGEPTHSVEVATRIDQALLYRLSGDANPLHVDPRIARAVGFERPILHGLCVYGIVGRVLLATYADSDPRWFESLTARFSRPTFPGDSLTIKSWEEAPGRVAVVVENNAGEAILSDCAFRFQHAARASV